MNTTLLLYLIFTVLPGVSSLLQALVGLVWASLVGNMIAIVAIWVHKEDEVSIRQRRVELGDDTHIEKDQSIMAAQARYRRAWKILPVTVSFVVVVTILNVLAPTRDELMMIAGGVLSVRAGQAISEIERADELPQAIVDALHRQLDSVGGGKTND
jgi:hypothetical protein